VTNRIPADQWRPLLTAVREDLDELAQGIQDARSPSAGRTRRFVSEVQCAGQS
jgi:hypothetical protein